MKIYAFLLTIALVLAGSGCSKTDEQPAVPESAPFTFTIGARQADISTDDDQTRASLHEKISLWESNDQIALYARSYDNNPLAAIAKLIAKMLGDGGKWAKFTGDGLKPAAQDTYFAAYPAVTINSSQVVFTIDAAQAATDAPELMATAKSAENIAPEDIQLNFRPVNAFLCVKMAEGLGITSVRFEGCADETVAGTYTYNFSDGTTVLTGTGKSITVENPGTECYITLPAMTLSKGYKLIFTKGSEQMVKSYGYGKAKEFAAGGIYTTPTVTEFAPLSLALGEVRSTYKNSGTTGLSNGKIYLSGNGFQGLPLTLVEEVGIQYNVKGSTEVSTSVYDKTLLDASTARKTFDLDIAVPTELYEVKMYLRDVFGNTYTTPAEEVGVLGANPAVSFSAASSWDTNGTVTKNNDFDLGGNGFRMFAALTDIAPSLVGSARFSYSGGRSGSVDGTLSGTTYTSDITSLTPSEWAAYAVEGTVTLGNGKTFAKTVNTTVTGIPYMINFYANSNDNYVISQQGWSLKGYAWRAGAIGSEGGLGLQDLNSYGISPMFCIPNDMDINVHGEVYLYRVFNKTSYFCADVTNSATTARKTTNPLSITSQALYPGQAKRSAFNWNLQFTTEMKYLSLSRVTNTDGRIMVYNVYIDYR